MTRTTMRALALSATVGFTLGCSGFMAGMEQGLEESAREAVQEARAAVATCEPGQPRDDLNRILDRVEKRLASGEMGGMEAAFAAGMVQGGVEDGGCDADDAKEIGTLYPDLVK